MSTNPDGTDTGELDHATLSVSVCGECLGAVRAGDREQRKGKL